METLNWRKASRSSSNGENCVELASSLGMVAVRDSKDPDGTELTFSRNAFTTFIAEVKNYASST